MGSTFHVDFQNVLQDCKQALRNVEPVEIQLVEEPVNVNDENAVIIQAKVGEHFSAIGYIPAYTGFISYGQHGSPRNQN